MTERAGLCTLALLTLHSYLCSFIGTVMKQSFFFYGVMEEKCVSSKLKHYSHNDKLQCPHQKHVLMVFLAQKRALKSEDESVLFYFTYQVVFCGNL